MPDRGSNNDASGGRGGGGFRGGSRGRGNHGHSNGHSVRSSHPVNNYPESNGEMYHFGTPNIQIRPNGNGFPSLGHPPAPPPPIYVPPMGNGFPPPGPPPTYAPRVGNGGHVSTNDWLQNSTAHIFQNTRETQERMAREEAQRQQSPGGFMPLQSTPLRNMAPGQAQQPPGCFIPRQQALVIQDQIQQPPQFLIPPQQTLLVWGREIQQLPHTFVPLQAPPFREWKAQQPPQNCIPLQQAPPSPFVAPAPAPIIVEKRVESPHKVMSDGLKALNRGKAQHEAFGHSPGMVVSDERDLYERMIEGILLFKEGFLEKSIHCECGEFLDGVEGIDGVSGMSGMGGIGEMGGMEQSAPNDPAEGSSRGTGVTIFVLSQPAAEQGSAGMVPGVYVGRPQAHSIRGTVLNEQCRKGQEQWKGVDKRKCKGKGVEGRDDEGGYR
jgi:hypothetical protein